MSGIQVISGTPLSGVEDPTRPENIQNSNNNKIVECIMNRIVITNSIESHLMNVRVIILRRRPSRFFYWLFHNKITSNNEKKRAMKEYR